MKIIRFSIGAILSIVVLGASVWVVSACFHPAPSFYTSWFASMIVIAWARDFERATGP